MRILIVKLSSLGDVIHTLPVVHDIRRAHPGAAIDWVVEPAFAPLLKRLDGLDQVIDCALRRWRRGWWRAPVRAEWRHFRERLARERYDAVIDLQGLTKSAVIARCARGASFGLANRTEGSSHEAPARWLVDHAIAVPPRIHAVDRGRDLVGRVLGHAGQGPAQFGLRSTAVADDDGRAPTLAFLHGTSRDDKLWPEVRWIQLGQRLQAEGWRIALPRAGEIESARAMRIADALGPGCCVWPESSLDELVDRIGATQGAIGVDSGLSHLAVALGLPHVQIYNFETAWRTGPKEMPGFAHQLSVECTQVPTVDAVESALWKAMAAVGFPPDEWSRTASRRHLPDSLFAG